MWSTLFGGLKTSSEKIERNVQMLIFFPISSNEVSACHPRDAHRTKKSDDTRAGFPRPRSSNKTSDEEIGLCSHGLSEKKKKEWY